MMKAKIFLILFYISYFSSIGQITTTKVAPVVSQIMIEYDSTENFMDEALYRYIGQELYLNGFTRPLNGAGYRGFYKDYSKSRYENRNIYKCCDSDNTSKYVDLVGKYFEVIEIIDHPDGNSGLIGERCFLKLREKSSGDIVYYEHNGILNEGEYNFPFIVVGFYEKQKQYWADKEFVLSEDCKVTLDANFNYVPKTDINTGKPINSHLGDKWVFKSLTINEKYFILSAVMQNSFAEEILIPFNYINERLTSDLKTFAYLKTEAENYIKKFGEENFNLILRGVLKLGMTTEMCRLSWGEPKEINKTVLSNIVKEQWVYRSKYLYFENDVLTAMQ